VENSGRTISLGAIVVSLLLALSIKLSNLSISADAAPSGTESDAADSQQHKTLLKGDDEHAQQHQTEEEAGTGPGTGPVSRSGRAPPARDEGKHRGNDGNSLLKGRKQAEITGVSKNPFANFPLSDQTVGIRLFSVAPTIPPTVFGVATSNTVYILVRDSDGDVKAVSQGSNDQFNDKFNNVPAEGRFKVERGLNRQFGRGDSQVVDFNDQREYRSFRYAGPGCTSATFDPCYLGWRQLGDNQFVLTVEPISLSNAGGDRLRNKSWAVLGGALIPSDAYFGDDATWRWVSITNNVPGEFGTISMILVEPKEQFAWLGAVECNGCSFG